MNHLAVEEKILAKLTMVLTSTGVSDQQRWAEEVVDFEETYLLKNNISQNVV